MENPIHFTLFGTVLPVYLFINTISRSLLLRGDAKNKLPVWAFRFKKLRQPEKTNNFQENVCRLSQILKSSPPTGVCPLMKETIRMSSCGLLAFFSCAWFLSCMPKPAIYFSRRPLRGNAGRRGKVPVTFSPGK